MIAGPAPSGRIAGLDGLRGLGMLFVALLHAKVWHGPSGLCVLFVLSGFLITSILARKIDGPKGLSLSWFFGRRARRLVPGLLLFLIGLITISTVDALRITVEWADVLIAALFNTDVQVVLQGQAGAMRQVWHLWSLGVEVKFYIFWPFLMFGLGRSPGGRNALIVIRLVLTAATWAVREALRLQLIPGSLFVNYVNLARYDAIALGCAAALLVPRWRPRPAVARVVGGLALAGLFLYPLFLPPRMATLSWHFALSMSLTAVLCLVLAASSGSALGRWMDNPILRSLGQWSYGMYLWHPISILIVRAVADASAPLSKLAMILLAAAFGAASWHAVEKHFMRSGG